MFITFVKDTKMKKAIASAFMIAGISAGFISFSTISTYAADKCEDGYVMDEKTGKCVQETRGSFH